MALVSHRATVGALGQFDRRVIAWGSPAVVALEAANSSHRRAISPAWDKS